MDVTYSKNVFIPLTNACRNRCAYCGFRSDKPYIMSRRGVQEILRSGRNEGCKEALFTFGEKPEVIPQIKNCLVEWGYSSIIEYLHDLCVDAIEYGLLPHSNPGIIEEEDMKALKEVNASLGLMLESSSERLCGKGMPHEYSPGKLPEERMKVMENAGKLEIPFTTGILVGIGETEEELLRSLEAIKKMNDEYGHIQEIIIQNFKPKPGTPMENHPEPSIDLMVNAVRWAREMMPAMNIQVPPNLNPDSWMVFLKAGANDLGGVSPLTEDYINPEADWPKIEEMEMVSRELGFTLRERLPIYPEFIKKGWYSERLRDLIESYTDEEGLVKWS
jgi:7,8-didemethyl-8-hydroxy-5-deazariboflavin synthase CofG subunit